MNINEAIQNLKENCTCDYAKAYLNALPDAIDNGGTKGLCVQLLYVLENCKSWRGKEASATKKFIKQWVDKRIYK
jgi:hypothetical protein